MKLFGLCFDAPLLTASFVFVQVRVKFTLTQNGNGKIDFNS
jgi:hypothetical protein